MEYRGSTLLSLLFSLRFPWSCYYQYLYLSMPDKARKALTFSLHPLWFAARSLAVPHYCLSTQCAYFCSMLFKSTWPSSSPLWQTLQSFNAELLLHYMSMFVLLINEHFELKEEFLIYLCTAVEKQENDSGPSPSVTFTMQLQRHTTYYIVILFLPCFSNVMLTLLVFLLPTETGERIGVGINTLFTMWVNYLRVNIMSPQYDYVASKFC